MLELRPLHSSLRLLAVPLLLSASVGCQQPLAVRDAYFRPGNTSTTADSSEARRVVRYHRALEAARRTCRESAPPSAERRDAPDLGAAAGRAALDRLCAGTRKPSTAAIGGTSNAYRRWVEDGVRKLPEASATAAGAAGGS